MGENSAKPGGSCSTEGSGGARFGRVALTLVNRQPKMVLARNVIQDVPAHPTF